MDWNWLHIWSRSAEGEHLCIQELDYRGRWMDFSRNTWETFCSSNKKSIRREVKRKLILIIIHSIIAHLKINDCGITFFIATKLSLLDQRLCLSIFLRQFPMIYLSVFLLYCWHSVDLLVSHAPKRKL